jgi:hypothetical protein
VISSPDPATDVIVWLDPPILLAPEVAGRSWGVRVDGAEMDLFTPVESRESLTHRQESLSTGPIPRFPAPPLVDRLVTEVRTHASLSFGVPAGILAPAALRLRCSEPGISAALGERDGRQRFSTIMGDWLAIVRDWLAAWSGNVRETVEHEGTPAILAATEGDQTYFGGAGGTTIVLVQNQRPSSLSEWDAALRAASSGVDLPLEHQLIAEAVVQAHRRQHRHSVISAASATEVALARSAKAQLARLGWPEQDIEELLKGTNGILDLYRLLAARRHLPVSIRRVRDQLADPRNRAVHGGESPERQTVERAIRTARELLSASPLPTPESFR